MLCQLTLPKMKRSNMLSVASRMPGLAASFICIRLFSLSIFRPNLVQEEELDNSPEILAVYTRPRYGGMRATLWLLLISCNYEDAVID